MAERPIRILGVAPYEGMKTAMERAAESYPNVVLDAFVGDLEEGAAVVLNNLEGNYDCIISRGGTAEHIRRVTDIPVAEIHLTVYDLVRSMRLAENYRKKYAILGFPSITKVAHEVCGLLQSPVDIFTVHSEEETFATLERIRAEGYAMVIGDMVTSRACRSLGMESLLITSGLESLSVAIDQAISMSAGFRRMRRENRFLRCAAQEEQGSLVVLDDGAEEYFAIYNTADREILPFLREKLREIPRRGVLHFVINDRGTLYKISGQTITIGQGKFFLFYYVPGKIPLRSDHSGIRYYTADECAHLLEDSFLSAVGSLGSFETTVRTLSATGLPVMLLGETGTGRVQLARYIYLSSKLTQDPFVTVDCELASEKTWDFLFEHPRSPLNDVKGTIYFQNITNIPERYARELLSVLIDTNLTRRLRFIFSADCGRDGSVPPQPRLFLEKLHCTALRLPTLRSRQDEIPSLSCLYLSELNEKYGKQLSGFEPRALSLLQSYDWPNNYTQFRRVLETLAAMTDSGYIRSDDTAEQLSKEPGAPLRAPENAAGLANRPLSEVIREAVRQTLEAHGGNQSAAARALGISRTTMWRYLQE